MRTPPSTMMRLAIVGVLLALAGCAHIPSDSYGIRRIRFHGVDQLDEAALRACLASREREPVGFDLGTAGAPTCDEPPFDANRVTVRLFTWPWEDWPTYDEAVFERDLDRIERWYRARGYYDATVTGTRFRPETAEHEDELPEVGEAPCPRRHGTEGCAVDIDVQVSEGEPVHVEHLAIVGDASLPASLRRELADDVELHEHDRFDEALHDRTKQAMVTTLREAGHACATVRGEVALDPEARTADVSYYVRAGGQSRFREVRVELATEARHIPLDVVRAATGIRAGLRFTPSALAAAQRDVYALGAFSSVEVEAVPVTTADNATSCTGEVDVVVRVTPGRRLRYGLGAGLDVGAPSTAQGTTTDANQWNVHFLARFEDRNFLGGLRRLRIEDRPKVVFPDQFPGTRGSPTPGNEITVDFRQPAFLERSTTLTASLRHDYGLDPVYQNLRHFVDGHIDVQRRFLDGHLSATMGFAATVYKPQETVAGVAPYALTYLSESVTVDYRDHPGRPRRGVFFQVASQQAGLGGLIGNDNLMSWRYIRVEPEIRGYIPLPFGMSIAGRFRVGYLAILRRYGNRSLDEISYDLGPSAYRLRGGGPTSHRGYIANTLGDVSDGRTGADGGLSKWEANVEFRARVTEDFVAALFYDAGDVHRSHGFRFNQPHSAIGFGIRYYTLVGPIRLDFGFRARRLATYGGAQDLTVVHPLLSVGGFQSRALGAITLTIGDAF